MSVIDLPDLVAASRAGYDPFVLVDVSTMVDSINPELEELSLMLKMPPSIGERLAQAVNQVVGRRDLDASGQPDPGSVSKTSADPQ